MVSNGDPVVETLKANTVAARCRAGAMTHSPIWIITAGAEHIAAGCCFTSREAAEVRARVIATERRIPVCRLQVVEYACTGQTHMIRNPPRVKMSIDLRF